MLEFQNVSYAYDKSIPAVSGVSFIVPEGQITCLLGPNACGKSTVLKLACGLLKPDSGQIILDGRDTKSLTPKERARLISYFPQWRTVPDITVWELAAHGRYPHHSPRHILTARDTEIIENALALTGAAKFSRRRLTELSGGQRQRACLAMTVAQDTPLLLLDEPTAYLDVRVQLELTALLEQLKDKGKTILMVLHDLSLAFSQSDNVLMLQDGKMLYSGSPSEAAESGAVGRVFGVTVGTDGGGQLTVRL